MSALDWWVLILTVLFILIYGTQQYRKIHSLQGFYKAGQRDSWHTIGLSVMATQASAITFLSTPGQGYADGMGFVQFYFGLPLALIFICVFFLPKFLSANIYTAYEIIEHRLGLKNRLLTSALFLIQRGAAAGITILAPSLILSLVLNWDLNLTILFIGAVVLIYTVSGGSPAVNLTNKLQMLIMLLGLILTFIIILIRLPNNISFIDSLTLAGIGDKMNIVDFSFNLNERYNIWSGIAGGFFLALSYFGTDQSQVQRYLSGKSLKEARIGLLFNALFKIPVQFLILLIGVLVFVFYQFNPSPLNFNKVLVEEIKESPYKDKWQKKEEALNDLLVQKHAHLNTYALSPNTDTKQAIKNVFGKEKALRKEAKEIISQAFPNKKNNDTDFVFLTFILNHIPHGMIGLLIAVVFFASMSSSSAEINALGTCTMIDFYQRLSKKEQSKKSALFASRSFNFLWGVLSILFAFFFSHAENLIQGVNIIGSLFYGNILGIFLICFFIKRIKGGSVFISAIITQAIILGMYFLDLPIGFLWFNFIACILVISISYILTLLSHISTSSRPTDSS